MTKFCIYDSQLEVVKYALTNGGKKEIEKALDTLKEVREYYAIAGISKADIAGKILGDVDRADEIEDTEIEQIAEDMGDTYLDNGYWIDLDCLAEFLRNKERG